MVVIEIRTKRPMMAKVACNLSSLVVITSDNPRFEKPENIIKDMVSGLNNDQMKKVISISNRRQASIRYFISKL